VRNSVANSLNDISKDNPGVVLDLLHRWQTDATDDVRWITGHALRTLVKQGHPGALALLGYPSDAEIAVHNLTVEPTAIAVGDKVTLSFDVESRADEPLNLMVDYVVYHMRANGTQSPKVFKLTKKVIEPGEVLQWICDRRDFVDGVVVTGGEPTIQPGLAEFIADVRLLGFGVKLDTNGTHPEVLAELLQAGLLDYVAMDVKAPRDKYDEVCGTEVDQKAIDTSIRLLTTSRVTHEFRTTVLSQLNEDDIVAIARRITGAQNYVLQRLRPPTFEDGHRDVRLEAKYHPPEWFERVMDRAIGFVRSCETRGIDELAFVTRRCA